jgi:hypothetical protein
MKIIHCGYEINVTKEKSMGGDLLTYYSIFRVADGFECSSGFEDTEDSVIETVKFLKERVDNELMTKNPWGEK